MLLSPACRGRGAVWSSAPYSKLRASALLALLLPLLKDACVACRHQAVPVVHPRCLGLAIEHMLHCSLQQERGVQTAGEFGCRPNGKQPAQETRAAGGGGSAAGPDHGLPTASPPAGNLFNV
ncbi:hypothetical protein ABPG75_002727 [Micractinium tetrahymenae]